MNKLVIATICFIIFAGTALRGNATPEDSEQRTSAPLNQVPFTSVNDLKTFLFENDKAALNLTRPEIEHLLPRDTTFGVVLVRGNGHHSRVEYRMPLADDGEELVLTFSNTLGSRTSRFSGFWIEPNDEQRCREPESRVKRFGDSTLIRRAPVTAAVCRI
ncbi:hypothetical protein [Novipirellula sp.]|uniref:hypothetical protein n=1 Tax=Novipirellula sp. TaxID=2795430 RepID=UPI0035685527